MDKQIEFKKIMPGLMLAKVLSGENISPGGIIIGGSLKKQIAHKCLVVDTGKPKMDEKGKMIPCCAHKGDIVYIRKYQGVTVRFNREDYLFLNNEQIVGIERK